MGGVIICATRYRDEEDPSFNKGIKFSKSENPLSHPSQFIIITLPL